MSIRTKRMLLSFVFLIIWCAFMFTGGAFAGAIVSGLGGWLMGSIIYDFTTRVFPDDSQ